MVALPVPMSAIVVERVPLGQKTRPEGEADPVAYTVVIIDEPAPGVRRITMNRPEKRNALFHTLRGEILAALREGDADDAVKVQIIRGAGKAFSAGYDLGGGNEGLEMPYY